MPSKIPSLKTDIAIVGGGIAGLWALNHFANNNYNVILLESDKLGCGQTIKSQGIIHGGIKYALTGILNRSAQAIENMPKLWNSCLQGHGPIDLQAAKVLSYGQFLWSTNKISTQIASFFASKALRSRVQAISDKVRPDVFTQNKVTGPLYKLEEIVLDIPSVLQALVEPHIQACIKIDSSPICEAKYSEQGDIEYLQFHQDGQAMTLQAQRYLFVAGNGNNSFLPDKIKNVAMQQRPLHMVLVKSDHLPPLYGHCLGIGSVPRITITTHYSVDKQPIWYLGGKLSEDGVFRDSAQQIAVAQKEIATLFPVVNLKNAHWASFIINRAESAQVGGKKPDGVTLHTLHNAIIAWPTKLALAPVLADSMHKLLQQQNILPNKLLSNQNMASLKKAQITTPIWDELLCN